MIDKKTFKTAISTRFKDAAFIKKGQSWYLNGRDAIIVVNLQKSNWDDSYYLNIGIWLKVLGDAIYPQYNHCHLYFRAEALFPEQQDLIRMSCDLEMATLEILVELTKFIENMLIPFLRECTDGNGLKKFTKQGLLEKGLVRIEARRYLTGE